MSEQDRQTADKQIIELYAEGVPEGQIVKQTGLTRHVVRTAITYEEGRKAGYKEALEAQPVRQADSGVAPALRVVEGEEARILNPFTGDSEPSKSPFGENIEALIGDIIDSLRKGVHVKEKELQEKYHVSHTALYKYRAVAVDRLAR